MRIVGISMALKRLIITPPPSDVNRCKPAAYKEEPWEHYNGKNMIKPKKIFTV